MLIDLDEKNLNQFKHFYLKRNLGACGEVFKKIHNQIESGARAVENQNQPSSPLFIPTDEELEKWAKAISMSMMVRMANDYNRANDTLMITQLMSEVEALKIRVATLETERERNTNEDR